ncbi:NAD(P)/FAD-dependent oxidoreductase [Cohnella sp. WQ 127256]|uniref:NAD(P)/FAD-dependent oxidoreductase n=1 Tax=Cohnella sp. WQ 127256 TaxID=2938790 RepID=UPI002117FFBF|nr:NAD(P)/FAD-dependent oxidoreductase [Cohnella sp. WQ 127256]
MKTEFDAVVIGAGIAGSSMAYCLAKQGWQVALVDKDTFPRHKACGEFISPESLGTLKTLELDGIVASLQPSPITLVRLHTERGVSLTIPLTGTAMGLSRQALDASLQRSALDNGASVYTGRSVSELKETVNGHVVELASKEGRSQLTCRTVIAAWGRRPLNGFQTTGQKHKSNNRTYVGIKSHYTRSDSDPVVDLYFFQGGYIGISPIEGGHLNVAALITNPALIKHGGSDAIPNILKSAVNRIPVLKKRLEHAIAVPGTQAATFPVIIRPEPNGWNGIPCIGDAVAVIPPFCGDGMAMALRSVELCAPRANSYLLGQCSYSEWKNAYTMQIKQQLSGALRWGSLLERILTNPILSSWLLQLGSFMPGTAEKLVRATRLRG